MSCFLGTTPAVGEDRHSPAPRAGNWVRFSCSIPPLLVLSHSMPMINTTGKLASFWRFPSPLAPSLRIHWPQFSRHSPPATRHSPLPPTTLPRWLPPVNRPPTCQRPNRTRSRRAGPLSHYAPNQAIPAEKSIRCSLLAAVGPMTILSWPEALNASSSRTRNPVSDFR